MEWVVMKDILYIVVLILVVIAVGMAALNQTLAYYYKAAFLATPCQLCIELNPDFGKWIASPSIDGKLNLTFNPPNLSELYS